MNFKKNQTQYYQLLFNEVDEMYLLITINTSSALILEEKGRHEGKIVL